jgi:hypothetical protein
LAIRKAVNEEPVEQGECSENTSSPDLLVLSPPPIVDMDVRKSKKTAHCELNLQSTIKALGESGISVEQSHSNDTH